MTKPNEPRNLRDAHEIARDRRPAQDATSSARRVVHQSNARREVATLADAREAVFVLRPERDAHVSAWVEFHRANAAMYERVAEVDSRHHWEALYWVGYELRQVEKLTKKPEWRSGFGVDGSE